MSNATVGVGAGAGAGYGPPWALDLGATPSLRTSQLNVALAGTRDKPIGFVRITRQDTLATVRRLISEEVCVCVCVCVCVRVRVHVCIFVV